MISTLKKLQARKAAQGDSGGFTLIELLIVIVVLGILAAVVVFSLGSVTSKSAVAACQADGATVNTAMSAYIANNGVPPQSTGDLTGTASGGPYLQSWPNNTAHYQFQLVYTAATSTVPASSVLQVALPTGSGTTHWVNWAGAQTCSLTANTASGGVPQYATVQ